MSAHPSTPATADARRVVVGASLVFAVLLTAGGGLILWARGREATSLFDPAGRWERIAVGGVVGVGAACVCALIVRWVPQLARLRRLAEHAVDGIEPHWHTIVVVSLAAGISEEFFFRGALEPAIGRWFSSLAFVALHGALRVRDPGVLAFAIFLSAASLGLSALNAWKGLESAMAAHAAYDFTMFAWLAHRAGARAAPFN